MATEPLGTLPDDPFYAAAAESARTELRVVPLREIQVSKDRPRSWVEAEGLRESIAANGLIQPVVVDSELNLVCGVQRLEACRALGWSEIPVVVRPWNTSEARLAEIDENLCRRELNALERAEHIFLRKRLWDDVRDSRAAERPANEGGDAKKARKKATSRKAEVEALAVFVDDTAKRTGRATATVREDIRIGELPKDVRSLARDTPISNNRRELLALTRMDENEQREALERVRSGEAKSVRRTKKLADPASRADATATLRVVRDDEDGGAGPTAVDAAMARRESGPSMPPKAALLEALGDARRCVERALSLWPEDALDTDSDDVSGEALLRQVAQDLRRVAQAVANAGEHSAG